MSDQLVEILTGEELAYLSQALRCARCQHLEPFHWQDEYDSGCHLDDDCPGFITAATLAEWAEAAARRDPNDPIPSIWHEHILDAVQFSNVLEKLIDRSFEDGTQMGRTIQITGHRYTPSTIIDDPVGD